MDEAGEKKQSPSSKLNRSSDESFVLASKSISDAYDQERERKRQRSEDHQKKTRQTENDNLQRMKINARYGLSKLPQTQGGYIPIVAAGCKTPFVDEMFCHRTINELETRITHEDFVHKIAQLYAFHEYGITYLVSAGGGGSDKIRKYRCKFCISCVFPFVRLPGTKFFRLDSSDASTTGYRCETSDEVRGYHYSYYRPNSDANSSSNKFSHKDECKKISAYDASSIINNHIVLNHPTFKTLYHKCYGDNPIHTIYSSNKEKTDNLLKQFERETKYHLRRRYDSGRVEEMGRSTKQVVVNSYTDFLQRQMCIKYLSCLRFYKKLLG